MNSGYLDKYNLKSSSFYKLLNSDELAYIKQIESHKEYKTGQVLFKAGSYPKGIYIIKKGKVKIFTAGSKGRESIIYIYKKSDYLGHRPLLTNDTYAITAMALENVEVSFIPANIFIELLNKSHTLAKKLLADVMSEFNVWINKITVFSKYGVKERVALSLLILGNIYQTEGKSKSKVTISLNRDDFANFVGTARESLVRTLRVFKDEKIISSKGTKITLLKPGVLREYLEEIDSQSD